jgi:hypothetical protein
VKRSQIHIRVGRLITLIIVLIAVFSGSESHAAFGGIDAVFVRNNTVIGKNEVASNVFRLKNNTGKTVRFHLNFSAPAGWTVLGQAEKEYELLQDDSIFVPVRIIPGKDIRGGTSYVITVTMASEKNVQFAAQNWYVSLPVITKWEAHLPIKHQFFYNNFDSSGVELLLSNEGNADEEIRITLVPDHRLDVLRKSDGGSGILTFTVPLPAGTDTLLVFPVMRKPFQNNSKSRDADLYRPSNKENFSFQVLAKSTTSSGSLSGTKQFNKATNV